MLLCLAPNITRRYLSDELVCRLIYEENETVYTVDESQAPDLTLI